MDEVHAIISYKDTTVEFKGKPDAVLESLYRFLMKQVPNLDLADKISLDYSLPEMIDIFSDYIKLTPEGPNVIVKKKIPDKHIIALYLVAYRIAKLLDRIDDDKLASNELQKLTNLKPKTISSRLSELVKMRVVEKLSSNGIRYGITTYGIHWLAEELLKYDKKL
jgi:hypothetical protein